MSEIKKPKSYIIIDGVKIPTRNAHRLDDDFNFREKIFLEEWKKINYLDEYINKNSTSSYLISDEFNKPAHIDPETESNINTLIQWLGSPVGYSFVKQTIEKIEKRENEASKKTHK